MVRDNDDYFGSSVATRWWRVVLGGCGWLVTSELKGGAGPIPAVFTEVGFLVMID